MKTQLVKTRRPNLFKLPILVFALALFTFSCSNEDAEVLEIEAEGTSIVELLESYNLGGATSKSSNSKSSDYEPTFEVLSKALARTKLASTVSRNRLTVFAPTDKAFAELGLTTKNITTVDNLAEILLYHVVGMPVYSNDLMNGPVETVNGNVVNVNLENGVMINDANVTIADLKARNGVIHVIDSVLFPPTMSIAGIADTNDNFSILYDAVAKAGLGGTLTTGGPFTVFAPTNQAFIDLLEASEDFNSLDDIPVDLLKQILLYHVVNGYVFSNQLSDGFVPTLNGAAVQVDLASGVMINDADVIAANVQATNGVIHGINKVLMPPTMNLVGTASSFAPEFSVLIAAATKAGLAGVLSGDGPYEQLTVFAPTNQAFLNFLDASEDYDSLDDFDTEEDIALLTSILLYHVAEGRIYSSDLSDGPVNTLGGSFDLSGLGITTSSMGTANLDPSLLNVQATNGVIHVLDAVLMP